MTNNNLLTKEVSKDAVCLCSEIAGSHQAFNGQVLEGEPSLVPLHCVPGVGELLGS